MFQAGVNVSGRYRKWPVWVPNRRVNRRTPTRYRTRVIIDGVIPSLHVDYKHSRIKQNSVEDRIRPVFTGFF